MKDKLYSIDEIIEKASISHYECLKRIEKLKFKPVCFSGKGNKHLYSFSQFLDIKNYDKIVITEIVVIELTQNWAFFESKINNKKIKL